MYLIIFDRIHERNGNSDVESNILKSPALAGRKLPRMKSVEAPYTR